jgi:hypothetical protein
MATSNIKIEAPSATVAGGDTDGGGCCGGGCCGSN